MINLSNKIIKLVQEIELDAIKELNKILKENDIEFFLRGGSVMGAVKYKGFIPWDDDMDIAIPRPMYDRLPEIFKDRIIAGKYQVLTYQNEKNLHCYFPRMLLLEAERKRVGLPKNTNLGLHLIDIIPLDGAPSSKISRKIYFIKVYILRFLASLGTTYKGDHKDMHTKSQKAIISLAKHMKLHKIFKQNRVYEMQTKLYKKYHWKRSAYSGTINASLYHREIMPTEIWGDGKMMKFESEEYRVPSLYDSYLKRLYGNNYMNEEPDEEHKKSHLGIN